MRATALGLALAFLLGCSAADPAGDAARPHALILITLDTTRADHVAWSGPDALPSLSRAFADGWRFEQAVAVAPVTGPSHASMLTGLMPIEHRLLSNPLPLRAEVRTVAEALSEAGYRTAAFVSCSVLAAGKGFDQGYEHYDSQLASAYVPDHYERSSRHTSDRALAWLREHDGEPFHLWIHYFDPHAPYAPPGPHAPSGFEALERDPTLRPTVERLTAIHEAGTIDPERRDWYRALYAAEVRAMDAEIGRLLAYLERRHYADATVIALAGDHGEALGERSAYFEHARSLDEAVMRVPLALRAPGLHGRTLTRQVSHASFAATLLELAGAPVDEALAPSLLHVDATPESHIMLKEPHPFVAPFGAALREPPWKYVYWEDGSDALYHLADDPSETRNRVAEEPDRAARMRATIEGEILPALGDRSAPTLDEETREMLHALGYADAEAPEAR